MGIPKVEQCSKGIPDTVRWIGRTVRTHLMLRRRVHDTSLRVGSNPAVDDMEAVREECEVCMTTVVGEIECALH